MARKKHYLPRKDADRVLWLNNFASKVDHYALLFGITPAEVTLIGNMAKHYEYIVNLVDAQKNFAKQLISYKNTLSVAHYGATLGAMPKFNPPAAPAITPAGIFTYIGGMVGRIKGFTETYTEGIGKDLGIVGTEVGFKKEEYKPTINAKAATGMVVIKFSKKNVDWVKIYGRPLGNTDVNAWELLGIDAHPPFFDKRPLLVAGQPEKRSYRLCGVLNDEEIGVWSNEVEVVFGG